MFLFSSLLNLIILFLPSIATHPAVKGVTCHGPIPGVRYNYEYNTEIILNNNDGFEPAGFQAQVYFNHENIWQNAHSYLSLIGVDSVQFKPRALVQGYRFPDGPTLGDFPHVLVQHNAQTGAVENFFVPKGSKTHDSGHLLEPTQMNLIVALLNALRARFEVQVCFVILFSFILLTNLFFFFVWFTNRFRPQSNAFIGIFSENMKALKRPHKSLYSRLKY